MHAQLQNCKRDNEIMNLNVLFLSLNNIFQNVFFIHMPTLNAAIAESIAQTCDETRLNMLIAGMTSLFQLFYKVMGLMRTCTHPFLLRARMHNILFPDFVGSEFPGRDVFSDLERSEHLFWNLTGESMSFTRIVEDVGPVMSMYTRERRPQIRNSAFKLDSYNRVLIVFIWLRMYPKMSILSSLFMVSLPQWREKFDFYRGFNLFGTLLHVGPTQDVFLQC